MPTKRQVLDVLTREELVQLVDEHALAADCRSRSRLAERLDEAGPPLPELLAARAWDSWGEVPFIAATLPAAHIKRLCFGSAPAR